jgi:hypothetical protein
MKILIDIFSMHVENVLLLLLPILLLLL